MIKSWIVLSALALGVAVQASGAITKVGKVSVFVKDYDDALAWYTKKLGFEGRDLGEFAPGERWVTVNVKTQPELELVLYKGAPVTQGAILTLYSDDMKSDVARLKKVGVKFVLEPTPRPYGIEAMFQDLYEQNIVLVQPSP